MRQRAGQSWRPGGAGAAAAASGSMRLAALRYGSARCPFGHLLHGLCACVGVLWVWARPSLRWRLGGVGSGCGAGPERLAARSVYERAYRNMREDQPEAKEEAVMLLEAWRAFEQRAAAAAGAPGAQQSRARLGERCVLRRRELCVLEALCFELPQPASRALRPQRLHAHTSSLPCGTHASQWLTRPRCAPDAATSGLLGSSGSPARAAGQAPGVAAVERRMPQRIKRKRALADDEEGFEVRLEPPALWGVQGQSLSGPSLRVLTKLSSRTILLPQLHGHLGTPTKAAPALMTHAARQEYFDYIFPDDSGVAPNLKLLEAAQRWKAQQAAQEAS